MGSRSFTTGGNSLALRHSDDFNSIRQNFHVGVFLSNISIRFSNGEIDDDGRKILQNLVCARMRENLLDPEAMDVLLEMNGGIPVWLVLLVRSAALYALERRADVIMLKDMGNAVRDLRRDTLTPLGREDYKVLKDRHLDHRFTTDPDEERLLYNGCLIEYPNENPWCDAHPVLWTLLEDNASGDDSSDGDSEQSG